MCACRRSISWLRDDVSKLEVVERMQEEKSRVKRLSWAMGR